MLRAVHAMGLRLKVMQELTLLPSPLQREKEAQGRKHNILVERVCSSMPARHSLNPLTGKKFCFVLAVGGAVLLLWL